MSKIQSGGPLPYQLAQPPSSGTDDADTYVAKLLTQGGMLPPSEMSDSFEKAGVPSAQKNKTFADKALKWAGIIFAGALGVIGLQRLFGSGVKKVAESAIKGATK